MKVYWTINDTYCNCVLADLDFDQWDSMRQYRIDSLNRIRYDMVKSRFSEDSLEKFDKFFERAEKYYKGTAVSDRDMNTERALAAHQERFFRAVWKVKGKRK